MLKYGEILKVVNEYIGVHGGYLGNFSYRTHKEFYPQYCNLEIDPEKIFGTTRERFIKILKRSDSPTQAQILRGVLKKCPVSEFPEEDRERKKQVAKEIQELIERLDGMPGVSTPKLAATSETVYRAIEDARVLIKERGATSGVDRIHTTIHAYLIYQCKVNNVTIPADASITTIFKKLREKHPMFQAEGPRQSDIIRIFRSLASIIDAMNPIRNRATSVHPNELVLPEAEAIFVINTANTILHYLESKFSEGDRASENDI